MWRLENRHQRVIELLIDADNGFPQFVVPKRILDVFSDHVEIHHRASKLESVGNPSVHQIITVIPVSFTDPYLSSHVIKRVSAIRNTLQQRAQKLLNQPIKLDTLHAFQL